MAKANSYRLTRNVTQKECDWLDRTFKKGEVVFEYNGVTYGCVSSDGSAFTIEEGKGPFFELPDNAVKEITTTKK